MINSQTDVQSRFGWGVEGYGCAGMCEIGGRISILSMLPGESGYSGRDLLEEQDKIERTEFIKWTPSGIDHG